MDEKPDAGREAYIGNDPELAALVDAATNGLAKQEAARRRFLDNPAKARKRAREAREKGDR